MHLQSILFMLLSFDFCSCAPTAHLATLIPGSDFNILGHNSKQQTSILNLTACLH